MREELNIRTAEGGDTDAMVEIALKSWKPIFESFHELLDDELFQVVYPDWKTDKEFQIRSAAEEGSSTTFLVAEIDGAVRGFVSWTVRQNDNGSIAEIGNNAVDPDWRNHGIATNLYSKVLDTCRASGAIAVKVTTGLDESHAPARRAYEKAGFNHGIPMVTYWQKLD